RARRGRPGHPPPQPRAMAVAKPLFCALPPARKAGPCLLAGRSAGPGRHLRLSPQLSGVVSAGPSIAARVRRARRLVTARRRASRGSSGALPPHLFRGHGMNRYLLRPLWLALLAAPLGGCGTLGSLFAERFTFEGELPAD